jgi:hypothetical protein
MPAGEQDGRGGRAQAGHMGNGAALGNQAAAGDGVVGVGGGQASAILAHAAGRRCREPGRRASCPAPAGCSRRHVRRRHAAGPPCLPCRHRRPRSRPVPAARRRWPPPSGLRRGVPDQDRRSAGRSDHGWPAAIRWAHPASAAVPPTMLAMQPCRRRWRSRYAWAWGRRPAAAADLSLAQFRVMQPAMAVVPGVLDAGVARVYEQIHVSGGS